MKFFSRIVSAVFAAVMLCAVLAGCRLTPIDARKFEELKGTYALLDYYSVVDGKKTSLMDTFDYLYMIFAERNDLAVIYKQPGSDYFAGSYVYTCKYMSGSNEYIAELKLKFSMPNEAIYGGLDVNYLTVSPKDTLVCQKVTYVSSNVSGKPGRRDIVYVLLKHVSSDTSFGFVENAVGYNVEFNAN